MRRALLVFPSYDIHTTPREKEFQDFLVKARIMPTPLQWTDDNGPHGYNYIKDRDLFTECLIVNGFDQSEICVMDGLVDVSTFRKKLASTLSELLAEDDVFVLLFCGHGSHQELSFEHGSLVFSYNDRFTSEVLNFHVEKYKGTFIMLLNMCSAISPDQLCMSGKLASDQQRYHAIQTVAKRISISSSAAYHESKGNKNGSIFVRRFSEIFSTPQSYESFFDKWDQSKCTMHSERCAYEGTFFHPAKCKVIEWGEDEVIF